MPGRSRSTRSITSNASDDSSSTGLGRITRAFDDVSVGFEEARGYLAHRLDESPASLIVGALGVGYVVGGGVFTPLTARLVSWTIRAASLASLVYKVRDFWDGNTRPSADVTPVA